MKRFALFYDTKLDGSIDEACGSDAFLPLDGRMALCNSQKSCKWYIEHLAKPRNFKGYRIYTGSVLNPTPLTNFIKVEK